MTSNLLPSDGDAVYHGPIFTSAEAAEYFEKLRGSVPWESDEVVMFGRRHVTSRKVAWFGDAGCDYAYSGTKKAALPWTAELLELKAVAEAKAGEEFNSCLLNLYHDGGEGMGWHSDDERSLGERPVIASMSFGAARRFVFRHKEDGRKVEVGLEDGSLLVMGPGTQEAWQHSLPKSKRVTEPRINLTFRRIVR